MSLSVRCPNCGAEISECSRNTNYKIKPYVTDGSGNIICSNCESYKIKNKKYKTTPTISDSVDACIHQVLKAIANCPK